MLTRDELEAIRIRLNALRERLSHCAEDGLIEVQWGQDAEKDIASLLAEHEVEAPPAGTQP